MDLGALVIDYDLLLRIAVSAGCGALLGCEREIRNQAAGVRTMMLICIGACAFTACGMILADRSWGEQIQLDPGRIPSYVVAGVGFLGAGPVMQRRGRVDGLTTAATIWVSAAIGILLGIGSYGLALATTALVLCAIRLLLPVSSYLSRRGTDRSLQVDIHGDALLVAEIMAYLQGYDLRELTFERRTWGAVVSFRYRSRDPHLASMLTGLRERLGRLPTRTGAPSVRDS